MNFYKHHLGDYDGATAHLSWVEDMAYTRLIRLYYRTERPVPADIAQACRLVRAASKQERQAVESVLNEFFTLEGDGWHQKRCDEEIRVASERADRNREIGKKGGRPRKIDNPEETDSVSENKPTNNPDGFISEPTENPSQTPDSRLQENLTPPLPPSAIAQGGDIPANGHDLLGEKPTRPKRQPKLAMPQGWLPKPMTLDWVNRYLAEHALSEHWAQQQHDLFIGKAKANGWTYADWDQAYQNFFRENGPGGRYYRPEVRAA